MIFNEIKIITKSVQIPVYGMDTGIDTVCLMEYSFVLHKSALHDALAL